MAKTTLKKPSAGKKGASRPSSTVKTKLSASKKSAPAKKAAVATKTAIRSDSKKNGEKSKAVAVSKNLMKASARPAASARPGSEKRAPEPAVPQMAPPAPDNGKPRKNAAGFSSRDLEHFGELLRAKRREILGDMRSMEHEALNTSGGSNLSNLPIHMADMGTDNYEQEFTLGLVEKDRQLLREINGALAKLKNGSYGICEGTGKPINRERLEYQPWARFSIEYARKMERGGRPGPSL